MEMDKIFPVVNAALHELDPDLRSASHDQTVREDIRYLLENRRSNAMLLHQLWCRGAGRDGHPWAVSYRDLPPLRKARLALTVAITRAMAPL